MPVIYKINEYFFYFEEITMGTLVWELFISQDLENYRCSETILPQQLPSLQAAGLLAAFCLLVDTIGMWYKFNLNKYQNEDIESSNCRELISGVQIYLHLGF